jgi:hypothetical protein
MDLEKFSSSFQSNKTHAFCKVPVCQNMQKVAGGAVGFVDTLTCPTVWLPTYSEERAFYEGL